MNRLILGTVELGYYSKESKPDIIGVVETKLRRQLPTEVMDSVIAGLKLRRQTR